MASVQLEESWLKRLESEFTQPYMQSLKKFLTGEREGRKVIFPRGDEYFNALNSTPFDQVKVVILGQDPYHGPGQAHGLCFSVKPGVPPPPSLKNIYQEIEQDLKIPRQRHGYLQSWADQGVLLLNSVLTVERGRAGSHAGKGWETFTDQVIQRLNDENENLVFLLWGSYAQKKAAVVDGARHLVLKSPHPSPLSAHRGFFGCRHFSKANEYLIKNDRQPIDWSLPNI